MRTRLRNILKTTNATKFIKTILESSHNVRWWFTPKRHLEKNWSKMHSTSQKGAIKDSLLQNIMKNMVFYLPHSSGCHGNRKQLKDLQKDIFPIDHQILMKP